jgi:hypothetical protein
MQAIGGLSEQKSLNTRLNIAIYFSVQIMNHDQRFRGMEGPKRDDGKRFHARHAKRSCGDYQSRVLDGLTDSFLSVK